MFKDMIKKITTLLMLTCYWVMAQSPSNSLGGRAQHLLRPVTMLEKMMMAIMTIVGFAFAMATIVQYIEFRKNPVQTPISKPIIYLILALAFLFLPVWAHLSPSASLFNR